MSTGKRLDREARIAEQRGDYARAAVLYSRAHRAHDDDAARWLTIAAGATCVAFVALFVMLIVAVFA